MNGDGMRGSTVKAVTDQSVLSMAQFNCASCGKPMAARIPNLRVFNFPESSGVVMAHERIAKCPHCSMIYIPLISGLGKQNEIQIAWKPIGDNSGLANNEGPDEEKPHIV